MTHEKQLVDIIDGVELNFFKFRLFLYGTNWPKFCISWFQIKKVLSHTSDVKPFLLKPFFEFTKHIL